MEPSSLAGVFLEGPVRERLAERVTIGDPRMEEPSTYEGNCPPTTPATPCSGLCETGPVDCATTPPHGCREDPPPPPPATQDPNYCPPSHLPPC